MNNKSNTLLYVTFKEYPELGRMRVVEGETDCEDCALRQGADETWACEIYQDRTCVLGDYHFEACPK